MLLVFHATAYQRGSNVWPVSTGESSSALYPYSDPGAFKASSGWFHKFCCRHGLRLQGESLSADTSGLKVSLLVQWKRKGTP